MAEFLQVLLSGLATGSIYALAAIGFTLVWQAAQTVNFAQGEFVMLPAFFVLIAMHWFGWPLWAGLAVRPRLRRRRARLPVQEADRRADPAQYRPAADHHHHGAERPSQGGREAVLRRGGAAVSGAVSPDDHAHRRRGHLRAGRAQPRRLARRRRGADAVPRPHAHRPLHPGDRPEPGRGRDPRHRDQADGALYLPHQRRACRARLLPDLADLPGEVLQWRDAGHDRLHRGDRRRLQPDPRRAGRRPADRRARQPHGDLRHDRATARRCRWCC